MCSDASWADAVAQSNDEEYVGSAHDKSEEQSKFHSAFFEAPEESETAAAHVARQASRPSSARRPDLDVKRMPSVLSSVAALQRRAAASPGELDRATFGGVAGRMTGAAEGIETWNGLVSGAPGQSLRARSRLRKASRPADAVTTPEPRELGIPAATSGTAAAPVAPVAPAAVAAPATPRPEMLRRVPARGRRLRPTSAC